MHPTWLTTTFLIRIFGDLNRCLQVLRSIGVAQGYAANFVALQTKNTIALSNQMQRDAESGASAYGGIMPLEHAIIVGFCTAFATLLGHVLVANLQRGNERTKYFREKLLDKYSEFVALGAADLERARLVRAAMALGGKNPDYTEAAKTEDKLHTLRLDLLRASLQIRLLEADVSLGKLVEELANRQPFMIYPFPPRFGEGNYEERSNKFDTDIAAFEKKLTELIEAVLRQHSVQADKRRRVFS
jgi:hypothetical protein